VTNPGKENFGEYSPMIKTRVLRQYIYVPLFLKVTNS